MAKIKFERTTIPTCCVEFSRNPSPGDYARKITYMQPKDRANGGDVYIYDKGLDPEHTRKLHWRNIPSTDHAAFLIVLGILKGGLLSFTFTDFDGSTHTARITNADDIQSQPVMTGRESLTVELMFE